MSADEKENGPRRERRPVAASELAPSTMRVVHVIEALGRAGAERIALDIATSMRENGIDASIIGLRSIDEYPDYPSAPRRFLLHADAYRWPWSVPRLVYRLRKVLFEIQPTHVEAHGPKASMIVALSKLSTSRTQVLHGHDICWYPAGSPHRYLSLALQRWVASRMNSVVSVSQALATAARQYLHTPPSRVHCVPNGVDVKKFAPVERRCPTGPIVVAVVGRLIETKNPADALAALRTFVVAQPSAQLWFIGDGPLLNQLNATVKAGALEKNVRFLGTRRDIPELLAQAHLLWQLSDGEGLPLVCIEAMATGLPIIATNVTGNRELIEDGRTGWLVPPHSPHLVAAISAQTLSAPDQYAQIATAAAEAVQSRFTLKGMLDGHLRALTANTQVPGTPAA